MYSYREQREILDAVRLREGQRRRLDCPFCGGSKSLSISRHHGKRLWQCFKASCPARGVSGAEMDTDTLRQKLEGGDSKPPRGAQTPLPAHLSRPEHHDEVVEYLQSVNSLWAYENGCITIRYAPAENRVLFFYPGGRGAVGRALDRRKPKWKAYGDTSGLLTVGSGDVAVIVEDAASACSVARFSICSGCALLGTELRSEQKSQLGAFQRVVIALDKDASKKAVALKSKVEGRVPTSVALLEDDLKHCSLKQIERLVT